MKARLTALAALLISTFSVHAATDPLAEATRLVESGNYRSAVERLRPSAPFPRDQVKARFLYATALAGSGDQETAIELFEGLIADFPDKPEPYNNLAALYASKGQLDKAKEVLERGMRTNPSYAAVHDNLSSIYVEMARASYVKALRVTEAPHAPNLQLLYALQMPTLPAEPVTTVVAAAEPSVAPVLAPKAEVKSPAKAEPASAQAAVETQPQAPVEVLKPAPQVVAAPAAAVAAPVTSEPTAAPASAPTVQTVVVATLQEWARAWSARDVEAYLSFYAPDFNPTGPQSRAHWVAERRDRLSKTQSISVTLEEPLVTVVRANKVIVTVVQQYAASNYSDRTRKQITMIKVGERWMIRNEKSLGVVP